MSDPRFLPRRYSDASFNSPGLRELGGSYDWRIPNGGKAEYLFASVIQNAIRNSVTRVLENRRMEGPPFGRELNSRGIGMSADRLSGIFRGDDIMRLEDLGRFLTVLGPTCWPNGNTLAKALENAHQLAIGGPIDKRLWEV